MSGHGNASSPWQPTVTGASLPRELAPGSPGSPTPITRPTWWPARRPLPVDTGQRAEQLPELEVAEFTAAFAANALYWTRFTDLEPHFRRLDELLGGEHPIDARGQEGPRLAAASGTQGS